MINQQFNIAFDLFKFLSEDPDQILFESEHGNVKSKQFANLITVFALQLLIRDIKPRDLIGLDIDDTIIAHAMTQAITAIGASWIKISQQALESELPIKHVVFNTKRMYHGASVHKIDDSWFKEPQGLANNIRIRGYQTPDDIWMIAQSSGSTGTPKFIPITYRQYWHRVWDMNINMFDRRIQYFHTLFMPLKTSAQYHTIGAVFRKITVLVDMLPKEVVTYPKLFMLGSVMQTHKFVGMIDEPKVPFDIDSESTGAAMNKEDLAKFLKYFAIVQSNYGSTETTRTFQSRYTSIDDYVGDLGRALLDDIHADIVDDLDNIVPAGDVGNIRLKTTPRHVSGYYNDPEETAAKFKNGYFYPGDMGYKDADGRLFIKGRKSTSLINIGGIKFDPTAIETVAKELIGVDDCLVFKNTALPLDEQLSMFVVTGIIEQDRDHLLFTIINNVSKFLGISQAPKTFYFINSIPLNDNGKPWRSAAEKIAEKLEPVTITIDDVK
jgi:acyl-CoA synthetase (AMP-forming)/AMP-acid ligase II